MIHSGFARGIAQVRGRSISSLNASVSRFHNCGCAATSRALQAIHPAHQIIGASWRLPVVKCLRRHRERQL